MTITRCQNLAASLNFGSARLMSDERVRALRDFESFECDLSTLEKLKKKVLSILKRMFFHRPKLLDLSKNLSLELNHDLETRSQHFKR